MNGRAWQCDHEWARDDATSTVCVRCHARKEYNND